MKRWGHDKTPCRLLKGAFLCELYRFGSLSPTLFLKEVPIRSRNNIFQFITGELSSLLLLCKINWGWRQVYVPISIDFNETFFYAVFSIKWCEILILFYSPLASHLLLFLDPSWILFINLKPFMKKMLRMFCIYRENNT